MKKKYSIRNIIIIALTFLLSVGCDKGDHGSKTPLGPSSGSSLVTISPSSLSIGLGGTQTFAASGGSGAYSWSVSKANSASLTPATGTSTTFTAGNSADTLTVTAADDSGNAGTVSVTISATTLTVSPSVVTLGYSETYTFTASGGTGTYTWMVDIISFGSIGVSSGIFTTDGVAGTATITATDTVGSTGTASVIIRAVISVLPLDPTIAKGATQSFTASGGIGAPFTWTSSNTSIGTISDSGLFTAGTTAGTTTISATDSTGQLGRVTVTVPTPTITVTPADSTIANTATTLTQTFTSSGGSGTITWSVSGTTGGYTGAAIVSSTGILTFSIPTLANGTQILTIQATDDNGDAGTTTITLTAAST